MDVKKLELTIRDYILDANQKRGKIGAWGNQGLTTFQIGLMQCPQGGMA